MTLAERLPAAATFGSRSSAPEPSRNEHLVYVFFGLWTLVGLSLDGWAHRNQPELESFFTPWHAVFYSGFTGGAAWLSWMVYRRRRSVRSLIDAIPRGYELAVVGLAIFAVGGVGDGIWHTVFGIESSIDALLSPTHLLMLSGILLSATAPVRAYWRLPGSAVAARFGSFLPVTVSTALVVTSLAFFFMYANGLANWPMSRSYVPYVNELEAAHGVLSTVTTTVIIVAPILFLLRRWTPPLGTFTVIGTIHGLAMAGLDAFELWWQVIAVVVGGLTADLIIRMGGSNRRSSIRWIAVGVPLALWLASTLVIHLAWTVRWPPELWIGQIVLAVMLGAGLSLLAAPPETP